MNNGLLLLCASSNICGHTGLKQKLYILQGYMVRLWNRGGGGGEGGMNFLFEAGRLGDGTICKECGRGAGLVQ